MEFTFVPGVGQTGGNNLNLRKKHSERGGCQRLQSVHTDVLVNSRLDFVNVLNDLLDDLLLVGGHAGVDPDHLRAHVSVDFGSNIIPRSKMLRRQNRKVKTLTIVKA